MSGVEKGRAYMFSHHGSIVVDDDDVLWLVDDSQENKVKVAATASEYRAVRDYLDRMAIHLKDP